MPPAASQLGRQQPSYEIRARLDLLTEAVRAAPTLAGITHTEALDLLASRLGQRIQLSTLLYTLRSQSAWHELVACGGRIRFHAGVVAEIIAAQHRSEKLQRELEQEQEVASSR